MYVRMYVRVHGLRLKFIFFLLFQQTIFFFFFLNCRTLTAARFLRVNYAVRNILTAHKFKTTNIVTSSAAKKKKKEKKEVWGGEMEKEMRIDPPFPSI